MTSKFPFLILGSRIVLEEYKKDITDGGILIPGNAAAINISGRIIAIGTDPELPAIFKIGNLVVAANHYPPLSLPHNGIEYKIFDANQIVAIFLDIETLLN